MKGAIATAPLMKCPGTGMRMLCSCARAKLVLSTIPSRKQDCRRYLFQSNASASSKTSLEDFPVYARPEQTGAMAPPTHTIARSYFHVLLLDCFSLLVLLKKFIVASSYGRSLQVLRRCCRTRSERPAPLHNRPCTCFPRREKSRQNAVHICRLRFKISARVSLRRSVFSHLASLSGRLYQARTTCTTTSTRRRTSCSGPSRPVR